jgi:hypothetical protein
MLSTSPNTQLSGGSAPAVLQMSGNQMIDLHFYMMLLVNPFSIQMPQLSV